MGWKNGDKGIRGATQKKRHFFAVPFFRENAFFCSDHRHLSCIPPPPLLPPYFPAPAKHNRLVSKQSLMCVPFLPGKGGEGGQWPPLCLTICTYTRQQNLQKEGQQLNSQYHHLVLYYVSVCYSFFKVRIDLLCTSCMFWVGSESLFPDPEMIIMLSQPSLLPVSMFALCIQPVLCTRVKTGASVSVTRKKALSLHPFCEMQKEERVLVCMFLSQEIGFRKGKPHFLNT